MQCKNAILIKMPCFHEYEFYFHFQSKIGGHLVFKNEDKKSIKDNFIKSCLGKRTSSSCGISQNMHTHWALCHIKITA